MILHTNTVVVVNETVGASCHLDLIVAGVGGQDRLTWSRAGSPPCGTWRQEDRTVSFYLGNGSSAFGGTVVLRCQVSAQDHWAAGRFITRDGPGEVVPSEEGEGDEGAPEATALGLPVGPVMWNLRRVDGD